MELEEFKCTVCPTIMDLAAKLKDELRDNKKIFTDEADCELACSIVEKYLKRDSDK